MVRRITLPMVDDAPGHRAGNHALCLPQKCDARSLEVGDEIAAVRAADQRLRSLIAKAGYKLRKQRTNYREITSPYSFDVLTRDGRLVIGDLRTHRAVEAWLDTLDRVRLG